MQLSNYLAEVNEAVHTVMAGLKNENEHLKKLRSELDLLTHETAAGYETVAFLVNNLDFDDEGLATGIYWDTYFGPDKTRAQKMNEIQTVLDRISARNFSVTALAGSLLQIARQGISAQYGKTKTDCPLGRKIYGLPLHEIIWQGRNQALHWEEGKFHTPVNDCFEHLGTHADPVFKGFRERSMALEIIELLKWTTPEDFFRDMKLLSVEG
jgi:hypothetical protein